MLVFVQNKYGKPLMPCSTSKARKLLRCGKVRIANRKPFTIKFLHGSAGYKQEIVVGMDTGSKVIGTVAITNGKVIYQAETLLRGEEIKRKMKKRSMYRRNRRTRKVRYRKPRFLNRAASRRKGRLAPSVRHKVDAHFREKRFVESLLPVSKWVVETASFDISKITSSGETGQEDNQLGHYNTRQYVLDRDKYTCQKCKKKNLKFQIHHIVFRSNGGTDAPANLITLCEACHTALHKQPKAQEESLKLQKIAQRPSKHATEVSIVAAQLRKSDWKFKETFGYITKFNREKMGLTKSHYNDAVAIAAQGSEVDTSKMSGYIVRRLVSKGDYQQTKGARSEKRIPTGKLFGFRKFDYISSPKGDGFVKGKRSTGYFLISDIFGTSTFNSGNVGKNCFRLSARKLVLMSLETCSVL